jgi:DNA-binding response OmpR family regulator
LDGNPVAFRHFSGERRQTTVSAPGADFKDHARNEMSAPSDKPLPAKRILLVEDDAAICYFLERVLRKTGYIVGVAGDGSSGLHLFRRQPWDLVITDRIMPRMNGETLASAIKTEAPAVPIVLITGFPRLVKRPELFDAVFGKPFSMPELLAGIAALLGDHAGPVRAGE